VKKKYQSREHKSNPKFEMVRGQKLLAQVPLPMAEVWAEMQARVEELTGQAGLQILRAVLENEVTRRVGPPHRPNPSAGCVRWGKQPGYVVFAGQKVPLEPPAPLRLLPSHFAGSHTPAFLGSTRWASPRITTIMSSATELT